MIKEFVCVYGHMYACMYILVYATRAYTYIYIHGHKSMHACLSQTSESEHTCIHATYIHIHIFIHTYSCINTYIYTCIY